ncbi:hypothetical protein ACRAWB_15085 [Leifsonia poae]|uniref:hypothetical protein n=1 Tax=Leifsonia poae TaxID=110933 RepID=UPI003D688A63
MKPIHADEVRVPRKPWWVLSMSRRYALVLGIFYPLIAVVFLVGWFVEGRWWNLVSAVVWLLLGVAAWASYFWYRKLPADEATAARHDGGVT